MIKCLSKNKKERRQNNREIDYDKQNNWHRFLYTGTDCNER